MITLQTSVIIATKNRPRNITSCIRALLTSAVTPHEILILDQSKSDQTKRAISTISHAAIQYFKLDTSGKSNALNYGIMRARGDILIFTDDDCIASTNWIATIQQSFERFPEISAVFGKTLPHTSHLHGHRVCPCTFTNGKYALITRPCIHYKQIGFGNNMAIRKSVFHTMNTFKQWLGPGSMGSNAEDAEMALRLLIKGHKIFYNPKAVVYHNKWLTHQEMKRQSLSYSCGEMACYGYFYFQGHAFASDVVWNNVRDSYYKVKNILKNVLLLHWNKSLVHSIYYTWVEILYRGRGLLVGGVYSLIDPIR